MFSERGQSIKEDREIGGVIYETPDGKLKSSAPVFGDSCPSNEECGIDLVTTMAGLAEAGNTIITDWHTHGRGDFSFFSKNDVAFITDLHNQSASKFIGGFLGTPDGSIYFYRYGTLGTNPDKVYESTISEIMRAQIFIRKTRK
jgi:hypothetical protein